MTAAERREHEQLLQRDRELMAFITTLQESLDSLVKQYEELSKQNQELREIIAQLTEQLKAQTAQATELNEKLAQRKRNSHNSSKPPSSDGYGKPNPKSQRPTNTGLKPGGQKGHAGNSMKIENEVDETKLHYPSVCVNCPRRSECAGRVKDSRYEVDIIIRRNIICHKQMEMECPLSGEKICGEFPKNVTGTKQYGPNLQAFAVGLSSVGAVSVDRIQKLIAEGFGIDPSTGTIQNFINSCAHKLAQTKECISDQIKKQKVINADETGVRVNGHLGWIHSYSSGPWVLYAYNRKRGEKAMEDIGFLPSLEDAVLVHDFWSPYFKYRAILHAMCCSHLDRELIYAYESTKQEWADALMKLLIEINVEKTELQAQGENAFLPDKWVEYTTRYDAHVLEGLEMNPIPPKDAHKRGKQKKGKIRCLLERFRDYKNEILRFATDWDVPFTNNEAEQNIRFTKVKVKVAGCFRSEHGADDFATIMSYTKTAAKHGIGFFTAIREAIMGNSLALVQSWA